MRCASAPGSLALTEGENVVITGASGAGKSAFFRTLAGLWPYGRGMIEKPASDRCLFLPQKPYFPFGVALREALWYPETPPSSNGVNAYEAKLLRELGLPHLVLALNDNDPIDWCQSLSLGEQQRLSLARAILLKPRWLFLDEPFSALDEVQERRAVKIVSAELIMTTIVYVMHTSVDSAMNIRRSFDLRPQRPESRSSDAVLMERSSVLQHPLRSAR